MLYKIGDKEVKIPDKEIAKSMNCLNISKDEAIQMWLEDEGYLVNEEQEALEQKAKDNHITATIHEAKGYQKKTQKERVQKDDPTKERLVAEIAETVRKLCGNAEITNKTKMIAFELDGEKYELNLVRKRKPKEDK